mmetsp:Transcript_34824/g.68550  ORF Transcript_34824/g.68550 Transcript_34824/m.68550 type:complete len:81 (+) Transcript_34824:1746-1988(+)
MSKAFSKIRKPQANIYEAENKFVAITNVINDPGKCYKALFGRVNIPSFHSFPALRTYYTIVMTHEWKKMTYTGSRRIVIR